MIYIYYSTHGHMHIQIRTHTVSAGGFLDTDIQTCMWSQITMPPTIIGSEPALSWREGSGVVQAQRVAGTSGAAAADLGTLRMSDPQLADGSEIEPIVHVSVCVCGCVGQSGCYPWLPSGCNTQPVR